MRNIRLEKIKKSYDGEVIIENLDLTIPGGTIFALLGPSGSGKTTILRLIAGFETVDEGKIFIGDRDITHVPVHERNINTVFQHYALFPHLNVFENIAYGLRVKNLSSETIQARVQKVLKVVHLEKHVNKSIGQLSGGQQQRVALARAIVNEPDVLLLDEPLAALDPELRERMLIELIDLQSILKTTFIYVTHDHFEALPVADVMAIMNRDGQIEQVGTPKEIYEFPVSSFVAQFVGTTNLISGKLVAENNGWFVDIDYLGRVEVAEPRNKNMKSGSAVIMSLRPEKIDISKSPLAGFANATEGTVRSIVYHGRSTVYNVRLANDFIIQIFEQNEEHFPKEVIDYDDHVYIYWQKENVVLLER